MGQAGTTNATGRCTGPQAIKCQGLLIDIHIEKGGIAPFAPPSGSASAYRDVLLYTTMLNSSLVKVLIK